MEVKIIMEFFRYFIFGIAGVSLVFWVAVIALWHTYTFPKIFKQDSSATIESNSSTIDDHETQPILGSLVNNESLIDRKKYSMKSLVVADFSTINNLKLDKLYTLVSLSVVFASFTIITYGLHSAFPQA